ncbi:MAG TPA: S8 family serine peptidase, partial [Blastocatellia bacterium]|nr:S8 family serine peptidase [Blastocatellia bacterium]
MHKISSSDVSDSLRGKEIRILDFVALVSEAKDETEVAKRLNALLKEIQNSQGKVILFVDELPAVLSLNTQGETVGKALRAAIVKGKVQIISATYSESDAKILTDDSELCAYFQTIRISNDANDAGFVGDKVSPDLRELMKENPNGEKRVRTILQVANVNDKALNQLLSKHNAKVFAKFQAFGAIDVELPLRAIEEISSNAKAQHISLDRKLNDFGHIVNTTGMSAMLAQSGNSGINGTNTTIAIIDSGIYDGHIAFKDRILAKVDFTGANITKDDPYGHGSHVAGLALGNPDGSYFYFRGIAYGSKIVNLRVLNNLGVGSSVKLLAALDWILANRTLYNIKVVNLSLGAPAIESYKNDPLCRAVRRLVDAGIVVVAAAGNDGKSTSGQKLYGLIHSPGNEPSAITVGATNTFGTDSRNDDVIASYS